MRIADGPALPLQAFARRLVINTAIARALHHGSQMRLRHRPQGGEVQAQWLVDRTLDRESPAGSLNFADGEMRADKNWSAGISHSDNVANWNSVLRVPSGERPAERFDLTHE
jgi:hypothetical protein